MWVTSSVREPGQQQCGCSDEFEVTEVTVGCLLPGGAAVAACSSVPDAGRPWRRAAAYLMPGRSLALVAMLPDSGHSRSTSSSGPQMDLF
ncbi:hypothetical protein EYF80_051835 [Liparis tanakae]|uniref:Uncharacterized protein n=1 Tax=Liparis tanakae TaxID=230148 RepID=A0A4Z2FA34_9TELE|nr:hypothetical protein EYF80_051835 [Liparis tanakae]